MADHEAQGQGQASEAKATETSPSRRVLEAEAVAAEKVAWANSGKAGWVVVREAGAMPWSKAWRARFVVIRMVRAQVDVFEREKGGRPVGAPKRVFRVAKVAAVDDAKMAKAAGAGGGGAALVRVTTPENAELVFALKSDVERGEWVEALNRCVAGFKPSAAVVGAVKQASELKDSEDGNISTLPQAAREQLDKGERQQRDAVVVVCAACSALNEQREGGGPNCCSACGAPLL